MRICLLRHGVAVDKKDPAAPADPQRELTRAGALEVRAAVRGLRYLGIRPSRIWSSPYLRARQTADIAAWFLGPDEEKIKETESLLPEADPKRLAEELLRQGKDGVLCVGHAPHLDKTIANLLQSDDEVTELEKAGAAFFEMKTGKKGGARLLWLMGSHALIRVGKR